MLLKLELKTNLIFEWVKHNPYCVCFSHLTINTISGLEYLQENIIVRFLLGFTSQAEYRKQIVDI